MEDAIPVSAIPIMSLFCSPIGIACLWMGVGSYMHLMTEISQLNLKFKNHMLI